MRAVVNIGDGVVELNYMWLPTWIGMNSELKARMEAELRPKLEGQDLTDRTLDEANNMVLDFLEREFPALVGLRDYLDGLKFIEDQH